MKLLTNEQYKILKNKIKKLKWENDRLKRDLEDLQRFCMNFATDNPDLDFPNSHDHKEKISPIDKIY